MAYANARPNSPKGRIFKSYRDTGEDAAVIVAKRLDVDLSRVFRWFKEWRELGSRPKKASIRLKKLNGSTRRAAAPKKAAPVKKTKPVAKKAPAPKKEPAKKTGGKAPGRVKPRAARKLRLNAEPAPMLPLEAPEAAVAE